MARSCLPLWPLILFGILEPLALTWASIIATTNPLTFFAAQAPHPTIVKNEAENDNSNFFPPQAHALTLQIGNVFLLLAALAIICSWTTHKEIAKRYLVVVACADVGHIYAVYAAVGPQYFGNVTDWNDMMWGNVGCSLFLHVNRWATVAGWFGRVG
ncbi:hypothetical protein SMMN14_04406 [Sphaerulina musiva]